MTIPAADLPIPPRVRALAQSSTLVPVWKNEMGGVTFRADGPDGVRFIKYGPRNDETNAEAEAERLRWAAAFTPVPRVVDVGGDATHEWLVTDGMPGSSAVSARWLTDPATAVRAIGVGLRALHDALPVDACPFRWDVDARIENARARGILVPDDLRDPPEVDALVVCHGDACAPNTLISDSGRWTAHVDLGALGVADRWADIAVAALSTEWNYGPGWQEALVEAYGVPWDAARISYYQRLWEET